MASHCCQSDVFSGQRTIDLNTPRGPAGRAVQFHRQRLAVQGRGQVDDVGPRRAGLHQRAVEPAPRVFAAAGPSGCARRSASRRRRLAWADAGGGVGRGSAGPCQRPRSSRRCASTIELSRQHQPSPDGVGEILGQPPVLEQFGLDVFQVGAGLVLGVGDDPDERFPALDGRAERQASVPMVDLAPPRGPNTLSLVPRWSVAESSCSASQRCIFDGGRQKWSGRYFWPQANRSRPPWPRRANRRAWPCWRARLSCHSAAIWPISPSATGHWPGACITANHRRPRFLRRPRFSLHSLMLWPRLRASISASLTILLLYSPAGTSWMIRSANCDRSWPSWSAVITSGPRRAYFSGKPRSKRPGRGPPVLLLLRRVADVFDQAQARRCTFACARASSANFGSRSAVASGSCVASSRRIGRPCSGCTPR